MTADDRGLPPERRLRRAEQFQNVLSARCAWSRDGLRVAYLPNGLGHPRLGLAIAKRALARAADRNRIKRLTRESFRHHQHSLGGWDLVVMVRSEVRTRSNRQIFAGLSAAWDYLSQR